MGSSPLRLSLGLASCFTLMSLSLACSGDTTPAPTPTEAPTPTAPALPISANLDLTLNGGFFSFPWPSDSRLLPGGQPDISGFPRHPEATLLDVYVQSLQTSVVGFGLNGGAYVSFDGPISQDALPEAPGDGLAPEAQVLLMDIDPASPRRGERWPLRSSYYEEETPYNPAHLLGIGPAWGFPLTPSTQFGAVVLRGLGDAYGRDLGPQPELARWLAGDGELGELYAPLGEMLTAQSIPFESVAAASVFTTQGGLTELDAIRDYLRAGPAPSPSKLWYVPEEPALTATLKEEAYYKSTYEADPQDLHASPRPYHLFEGRYQAPNFQSGVPPFMEEGGAILFDESGAPIVQYQEEIRFALAVPKGEPPAGGWPLVLYAHGTGGDYKSFLYRRGWSGSDLMIPRGVAIMGIDQPLHGPRGPAGTDVYLASFNFFNPDAARSNFRQAAADVFWQLRLAQETLEIPQAISPTGAKIAFNGQSIAFFGHSHGGLSGALLLPFEEDLKGTILSGAGGGLSLTILYRKDYVDFEALFRTLLYMEDNDTLDDLHPVMSLVQTLVDITDPINYGPQFFAAPFPGHSPKTILMSQGFFDQATPPITGETLALSARIPIAMPVGRYVPGMVLIGLDPQATPLKNNGVNGVTTGLLQLPNEGHSGLFRDSDSAMAAGNYLKSALDGQPVIQWDEWAGYDLTE